MAKDKTPKLVDYVGESSDEEIDEDLAFNSDDERMYGSLFRSDKKNKSKRKRNEEDSDSDDDDSIVNDGSDDDGSDESDGIASDDDDGDGGQFMLDLLNNLDKKEDDANEEKKEMRAALAHTSKIAESEFSSTAVKSSNLTLDQLMNGITDTKGFKSVKNAMRDMTSEIYENDTSSRLSTTKTPVAKIVSERADRKVNYEEQSGNVSEWTHSVKKNREAETLDFRPKERIRINNAQLVDKFTPTTDFEKEIAAALEEAGASDDKDIMAKEEEEMFGDEDDDDLGRNKLSPEEYRKRLGELSKMRALMFYEEQKRYHINKIKSKKYRKIRKKQRLRREDEEENDAADNDEELARELDEKAEMERMKERMSLKHRNTSKWAKRVLRRGGNIDVETRRALSEQIRKGDELKKKMAGEYGDDEEEEEIDLIAQARNILADTETSHEERTKSGIFQLAFMKKGIEAQRTRAKEEAKELIKELEGNESDMESDSNNEEEENEKKTKKRTASKKEMANVLDKGKLVASSLKFGNSNSVEVTGDIDLGLTEAPSTQTKSNSDSTKTISLSTPHSIYDKTESNKATKTASENKAAAGTQTTTTTEKVSTEESNPWLIPGADKKEENNTNKSKTKKKKAKSRASVSKQGIVNVADAINIISGETSEEKKETNEEEKSSGKDATSDSKIASLSQEELVRKAFATPNMKDIEDDFEKEKESMRTRDDHSKKNNESKFVSGWGSWAGKGAPAPKPPRKLPKRMAPPEKKVKRRKRQDDGKKDVIVNAKRIKKTAKFQLENIPYPYKSREQYERAMAGGIGKEWNVSSAVKNMTRAAVVTRAGKIIKPMSKSAKMKRTPAKF